MKKYLSLISKKARWCCAGILMLAVVGAVMASIWPVQLANLYTDISSGQISTIYDGIGAILLLGATYLTAECVAIIRRVFLDCVIANHESDIRQSSIEKMLKLPVAYTFGHNSGEKTAQLNQGVAGMSQLVKLLCNDVFSTALTAICTLVQVFLNAPLLIVGVMSVYLIFTIVISAFQIRSQNGIREKILHRKNQLDGNICQSISNLELIRSMNAETYERERLRPSIHNISLTEKKHHSCMGSFDGVKQGCKIVFQLLILVLSIWMVSQGEMAASSVIAVCLLFQQLVKPIDEVYRFFDEIASSLVKAKVLTEIFEEKEDSVFSITHHESEGTDSDIILEHVLITDPGKSKALAHYEHVRIPGGKIVALVGPSGCGKTTLVRCLTRYYPYIQGKIILFGKNLRDYTQAELMNTVCYMPQTVFFFSGTIRENLIYGLNKELTDAELYEALKKACILNSLIEKAMETNNGNCDVLSLPVAENGENFSGGQRQRLVLARAFLRNPKLFIFDESTANLDGENMGTVLDNLEEHARRIGASVLYISHDDRVTSRCDMVEHLHNLLNDSPNNKYPFSKTA